MYNMPLPSHHPVPHSHLPLTLISLEDWVLVTLVGPDAVKYLQSQVTADIYSLSPNQHITCAHCNAQGKIWSTLRLFYRGEGFAYLERRSVLSSQLAEIKKYAIFSKVTIAADTSAILLGIAGCRARVALEHSFAILPDSKHQVVQEGESTLLHFTEPAERFLVVTTTTVADKLVAHLHNQTEFNDSRQWLALDIAAGHPIIDHPHSALFIPQAINLQALHGISFSKGCYTGQETVARAKFRGTNKRALYWLEGRAERTPRPAEALELQLGENWRRSGTVLAAIMLADGTLWVQVVMNNILDANSKLRVRSDPKSQLAIKPLPYKV
ncbi:tRNA-modifying protein YgfZ [Serratia symbiotica]|nr:tRNA-modifying protein YgfZ [Serratia symbiotica]